MSYHLKGHNLWVYELCLFHEHLCSIDVRSNFLDNQLDLKVHEQSSDEGKEETNKFLNSWIYFLKNNNSKVNS